MQCTLITTAEVSHLHQSSDQYCLSKGLPGVLASFRNHILQQQCVVWCCLLLDNLC